jgi:hypothetical protein
MSQLVKTERQANFKGFKRFGAFKGLVEQKNVVFNSFVCNWAFFGTRGPRFTRVLKRPNLHTNSSNKLLFYYTKLHLQYKFKQQIYLKGWFKIKNNKGKKLHIDD